MFWANGPNLEMCKYEGSQDAVDYNQGSETDMRKEMGAKHLYTIFCLKGESFKIWNVKTVPSYLGKSAAVFLFIFDRNTLSEIVRNIGHMFKKLHA